MAGNPGRPTGLRRRSQTRPIPFTSPTVHATMREEHASFARLSCLLCCTLQPYACSALQPQLRVRVSGHNLFIQPCDIDVETFAVRFIFA